MAKFTKEEFERSKRVREQATTGFLHARTAANNPYRVGLSDIESYRGRREAAGEATVLLRTKSADEVALTLSIEDIDELMREWSKARIVPAGSSRPRLGFLEATTGDGACCSAHISIDQIESYRQVADRERLVRVRTKTGDDFWLTGTVEEVKTWIDEWWRQF